MKNKLNQTKILVVDFGCQYSQLIARRIREIGVYCQVIPYDAKVEKFLDSNPNGIILSGGPDSVNNAESMQIPEVLFNFDIPILGICYGMQLLAEYFGGKVSAAENSEHGHTEIVINQDDSWFNKILSVNCSVWMSHNDEVSQLPNDFNNHANSENCNNVIISYKNKPIYGLQFHPEVTHTLNGYELLKHFICNICNCEPTWKPDNIINHLVTKIKHKVGKDKVVLGLSGGVDSSVTAALLDKAIGNQVVAIFVDHGLLRENEAEEVEQLFLENFNIEFIKIDAKKQFLKALTGVTDPEEKRNIIGREFVHVFQSEAKKIANIKWLAQGTIYPDIIESAGAESNKAHIIKSHHNVGGLPASLNLKLIEPLKELFKDEVRKLGEKLKLPSTILHRHPFPGPGMAVRIIGEVKQEAIRINQAADAIFIETLRTNNWYHRVSQAFTVFLPIKTVGVKGDQRCYAYVIALRAVETDDFMTANTADIPNKILKEASNRIVNEVKGVSRVVYDISDKPPATIEWE